jgi:ankyrin repeat protein
MSPKYKDKWTPLHLASSSDVVQFLVEHGANMSAKDNHRKSPLHRASDRDRGHVDSAQFLVEHDADVSAKVGHLSTPLHWASRSGHVE